MPLATVCQCNTIHYILLQCRGPISTVYICCLICQHRVVQDSFSIFWVIWKAESKVNLSELYFYITLSLKPLLLFPPEFQRVVQILLPHTWLFCEPISTGCQINLKDLKIIKLYLGFTGRWDQKCEDLDCILRPCRSLTPRSDSCSEYFVFLGDGVLIVFSLVKAAIFKQTPQPKQTGRRDQLQTQTFGQPWRTKGWE